MTEIIKFISTYFPLPGWSIWIISFLTLSVWGLVIYAVRNYFIASREFHDTIRAEFEGLYPTPSKWPSEPIRLINILKDKFPRLEIAVHKFRDYLPCFIRPSFDRAWYAYLGDENKVGYHRYWQYVPHHDSSLENGKIIIYDNTKSYQDNFLRNVNNLLKFAKRL